MPIQQGESLQRIVVNDAKIKAQGAWNRVGELYHMLPCAVYLEPCAFLGNVSFSLKIYHHFLERPLGKDIPYLRYSKALGLTVKGYEYR